MTDRIHASVHQEEPLVGQSPAERAPAQAELQQLRPRNDSMLTLGQGSDLGVPANRLKLCIYSVSNFRRSPHATECGAAIVP
jgi:hypothetical protein